MAHDHEPPDLDECGKYDFAVVYFTTFGPIWGSRRVCFYIWFIAGLVYSKKAYSYAQLKETAFARAFDIYKYHVISLVIVMVAVFTHFIPETIPLWRMNMPNIINDPINAYFLSLLLINHPSYFDILPFGFNTTRYALRWTKFA